MKIEEAKKTLENSQEKFVILLRSNNKDLGSILENVVKGKNQETFGGKDFNILQNDPDLVENFKNALKKKNTVIRFFIDEVSKTTATNCKGILEEMTEDEINAKTIFITKHGVRTLNLAVHSEWIFVTEKDTLN